MNFIFEMIKIWHLKGSRFGKNNKIYVVRLSQRYPVFRGILCDKRQDSVSEVVIFIACSAPEKLCFNNQPSKCHCSRWQIANFVVISSIFLD